MKKTKRNVKWDFNKQAKRYDEIVKKAQQANDWMYRNYDSVLNQVVEFSRDILRKPQIVVIDLGIGTGNLAQKIIRATKIDRLIGIDSSSEMLKIAKRKLPNIETQEGDFLEIPVEDNSADLIISSYAFHHLTEEEKMEALVEMSRVLKKHGKIIIADLMFANPTTEGKIKKKLIKEGKEKIITEIEEEYYGYIDTLTRKFIELGFSVQKKQMTEFVWVICGSR